jgi:hypothetical protein
MSSDPDAGRHRNDLMLSPMVQKRIVLGSNLGLGQGIEQR